MMDQDIVVFSFLGGVMRICVCSIPSPPPSTTFFIIIIPQGIFFNLKHPALSPLEKKIFFVHFFPHSIFFNASLPHSF